MRPVLPTRARHINQPQIDLIDQSSSLHRPARPLISHVAARDSTQFAVNARRQILQRVLVSILPSP